VRESKILGEGAKQEKTQKILAFGGVIEKKGGLAMAE